MAGSTKGGITPVRDKRGSATSELSQGVRVIADSDYSCQEVTDLLRAHAIVRLLADEDAEGFANDLAMSAHTHRAYLCRSDQQPRAEADLTRSCSTSFFDALAAGDLALAAELASLTPSQWREGNGREEGFLWQRILGLLLLRAPKATLDAHLARFARVVAHASDPRLAVCRALHTADAPAFAGAFGRLLRQREAKSASRARRSAQPGAYAELETRLYVEGIAVLRLARALGFPIEREYPMCPAAALRERPAPATPSDDTL
jgi:hypothetical protein